MDAAGVILRKFDYDPATGRIIRLRDGAFAELPAGNGYLRVSVNREYGYKLAHRVAVVLMTGAWPEDGMHVHHIDGDRTNNRWSNLEVVTPRQNNAAKNQRADSNIRPAGDKFQVSGCTTVDTIEEARALRAGWVNLIAEVLGTNKKEL